MDGRSAESLRANYGGAVNQSDQPKASDAFQSSEGTEAYRRVMESGRARNQRADDLMLDWAGLRPGSRVLDVAAGTGEQTLQVARRIGPAGAVVATDISANMLAIAAESAREAGLANISTRVMDAQQLDFTDRSFDTAVCRRGLMFIPDVPKALGEIRRVLRPEGKLSVVTIGDIERNPFTELGLSVARRIGGIPEPSRDEPGSFYSMGAPGALERAFSQAGFRDVQVQAVPINYRFSSLADAMADRRANASPLLLQLLARLTDAQREQYWTELEKQYRQFDGPDGFDGPAELLVAAGTK